MAELVIKKKKSQESLRDKWLKIIEYVNSRVLDMGDVVWGLVLAILSGGKLKDGRAIGEHLFMIGPPGVGKSYVMDVFMQCVELLDDQYFDNLLHQFSTPDENLGGVDVKAFITKHEQRRDIAGFLPNAVFAVLDEIWKAGPVTTSFFKITNERTFRNGREIVKCPLITMLSASNEYPANPMDAPLWDRILFRYFVRPVTGKENWKKMNAIKRIKVTPPKITLPEILAAKEEVYQVVIPDEVDEAIIDVHNGLEKLNIELSPRRKEKMWEVVRANAWMSGRTEAIVQDVGAIWPCCWRHDREIPSVKRLVSKISNFELDKIMGKFDTSFKLMDDCRKFIKNYEDGKCSDVNQLEDIEDKAESMGAILEELEQMSGKIADMNVGEYKRIVGQIKMWHREIVPYAEKALGKLDA